MCIEFILILLLLTKPIYLFISLASTPSIDMETEQCEGGHRRNSSGTLLSPEVDTLAENHGFYLLKKDSQRRATLSKVLAQDGVKICEIWLEKMHTTYYGETIVTTKHLERLLEGFKEYLTDQSLTVIENVVKPLKEELNYDSAAINQLQFAVYLYRVSNNVHLKSFINFFLIGSR